MLACCRIIAVLLGAGKGDDIGLVVKITSRLVHLRDASEAAIKGVIYGVGAAHQNVSNSSYRR